MGQTQRWAPRNKQSSAAACISVVAGMDTRNRLARRPELTNRKRNPRGEAGLAGCCAATAHRAMEDDGHGGGAEEKHLCLNLHFCFQDSKSFLFSCLDVSLRKSTSPSCHFALLLLTCIFLLTTCSLHFRHFFTFKLEKHSESTQ